MASAEATVNGGSSSLEGLSNAEKLQRQHEEHEAHKVTVEDAPDEDLPSSAAANNANASTVATPSADAGPGSKAAGKQPVRDGPASTSNRPPIDTQSEELFPALGAPKAAAAAAPSMWSKKPAAVAKPANNAANGLANGTTNASSRTSTPASGMLTPGSTAPSQRGPVPQMSLPGRYTERIELPANMITPKKDLKKPVQDILRDINKRSKANVEAKSGPTGGLILEGSGPTEAVRIALRDAANQLCAKVRGKSQGFSVSMLTCQ